MNDVHNKNMDTRAKIKVLQEKRNEIAREKKKATVQIRNEKRKTNRLMAKATKLSATDLLQVYALRKERENKRKKDSGSSTPSTPACDNPP